MCECLNSTFSLLLKIINILYLLGSLALLGYGGYEALELLYFGIGVLVISSCGLITSISKILGVLSILLSYSKDKLTVYLNPKLLQWVNQDYKICVMILAITCGSYIVQSGLAFLYLSSIPVDDDDDDEINSKAKLLTSDIIRAANASINMSDDNTKSAFIRSNQIKPVNKQPNIEVENIRDRLRNNYSNI